MYTVHIPCRWALGVIAWEVFTGRPLFSDSYTDAEVLEMLLGQKQLPFEQDPSMWVLFDDPQVGDVWMWLHMIVHAQRVAHDPMTDSTVLKVANCKQGSLLAGSHIQ